MPIRKLSKAEAEANKKKQQVLRAAGYNIKVDGSWGPWQEERYRAVLQKRRILYKNNKASNANVGVLALPAAAYGVPSLLEGLGVTASGTVSLPAVAGALIAAPLAVDIYERVTGKYPQINVTPQQRQNRVYAADATRVRRPLTISRTRVGNQSRPMGEMYINPALFRSKILSMASEDTDNSDAAQNPSWETEDLPAFPPPQDPENEEPKDKKSNKLADKVSNIFRRKKSNNPKQPKKRNLLKKGWSGYKWSWYAPAAVDVVGNIAGLVKNPDTYSPSVKALDYRTRPARAIWNGLGEFYNPQSSTTDSTTVTPSNNPDKLKANQDTTNRYSTLDSIRAAARQASLNYLDSLESNQ